MPDTSTIAPAVASMPLSPSERSALRVLKRANCTSLAEAKPITDLTGATLTALRDLQQKSFVDWRRLDDVRVYWLTSEGEQRAALELSADAKAASPFKTKKVA